MTLNEIVGRIAGCLDKRELAVLFAAIVFVTWLAGKVTNPRAVTLWNMVKAVFVALVTFGVGFVFLAVGIVIIGLTTGAIP
jgi:hypothetical protein